MLRWSAVPFATPRKVTLARDGSKLEAGGRTRTRAP
jgi:hypothetical protein